MAIVKAEAVFNLGAGFSADELVRIRAAGAGKTVSFPKEDGPGGPGGCDERPRTDELLAEYAMGATADELAAKHGMSRRQVFYELKAERLEGSKVERLKEWRGRGLSWRELGRLLGKSHEAVRQMAGEIEGAPTSTG
jgi:hypothetical protein